jgi:hypothetical protein
MSYQIIKDSQTRFLCDRQRFCNNGSASYSEIINDICQALREHIEDFKVHMGFTNEDIIKQKEQEILLLKRKIQELDDKEISLWEKYSEEAMPKHIFEKLKDKYSSERNFLNHSLQKAVDTMPTPVDYANKVHSLSEALDVLEDESISAETKNKYLKSIISRIDYKRERPIRMSIKEGEEKGLETTNGWYSPPYELKIELKV